MVRTVRGELLPPTHRVTYILSRQRKVNRGDCVGWVQQESPVTVLWWRSVGHTHTGYATEVFLDMVLEAQGKDPVQGRLDLLKSDRGRDRGVLEKVAEMAGWDGTRVKGDKAYGVAVHESFETYVAQIAEVSDEGGMPILATVYAPEWLGDNMLVFGFFQMAGYNRYTFGGKTVDFIEVLERLDEELEIQAREPREQRHRVAHDAVEQVPASRWLVGSDEVARHVEVDRQIALLPEILVERVALVGEQLVLERDFQHYLQAVCCPRVQLVEEVRPDIAAPDTHSVLLEQRSVEHRSKLYLLDANV